MVFDVNFVRPASQTGQTKVVQENVGDRISSSRTACMKRLLTSGNPGSDTTPFSVWSGECERPFATLFRHKTNYVDLRARPGSGGPSRRRDFTSPGRS